MNVKLHQKWGNYLSMSILIGCLRNGYELNKNTATLLRLFPEPLLAKRLPLFEPNSKMKLTTDVGAARRSGRMTTTVHLTRR